jgi:hypothetical protein
VGPATAKKGGGAEGRAAGTKRKWFQVTRFTALFTTGMHRTEHCNLKRRAPCLSAPRFPFFAGPGSMLSRALQTFSWLGSDARNGLSLACNGCGFHRLHSRVNAPGLPLRFPADRFRCPFHLRLRYRPTVCCPRPATSTLQTRCSFLDQLDLPLLRPPLPFGTVTSLRIKAFSRTCCKSTRLPIRPDLRSLPAAGLYY